MNRHNREKVVTKVNDRVDYSELVSALQDGDEETANELLVEVIPRLIDYLRVVMRAPAVDAEECAYQAFTDVLEYIREENIHDKKYIFSYLIKTARHEYLRHVKQKHRFVRNDLDEGYRHEQAEPAMQIQALMEKERMEILSDCLGELNRKSRKFIQYILDYPEKTTKELSARFRMSEASIRTKKSRIIDRLHFCFKTKSNR